jgi:hypothetical protein
MVGEMKRLAGYLPDPVFEYLEKWSDEENRSLSSLVGFLLERAVRDRQRERGEAMPAPDAEPQPNFAKFSHVVMHHMTKLVDSGKFPNGRLKELMGGQPPTELELVRVALLCGLTEDYVSSLPINGESKSDKPSRTK